MQSSDGRARWPGLLVAGLAGCAGSVALVLGGAAVGSIPRPHRYRWWLHAGSLGYHAGYALTYAGVAVLTASWIAVGRHARARELTPRRAWALLGLWGTPLALGAPVFSRDLYSYVADGVLARRGFNPYVASPHLLAGGPLYDSIAQVWRHAPSPYGPLFEILAHATASAAGGSLIAQVLAFRLLAVIGVAALMAVVPALARRFGADPGVALWLTALSPLALFGAVSSGHNDALMLALLAVGLYLFQRGQRVGAAALIALAATVKIPALAGLLFVYAGAWSAIDPRRRWRLATEAVAVTGAVFAAVTGLAGYGWRWLSPSALSIPTQLHVLITPVVAVGVLLASGLHAIGAHAATRGVVTATQHVGEALAVVGIVVIVCRTRADNVIRALGAALLLAVWLSPTVWPWYFWWGVTVLSVTGAQRSRFLALAAGGAMLLVGPGGTPMIGGNGYLVAGPAVILVTAWFVASRRASAWLSGVDRAG
ncbi:MAG: polyprenol phosphomannose-dependent alpha 1,6 mannosyltransferase MptB [Acidobacteriota bacterium]|nr:polyprenol phosphomannose-dependent alpha 1,6 mannosyltransferase MptB [Acidobacteriota bacterium]